MLPRSVLSSVLVLGALALAAPGLAQQRETPEVLPPPADNADGAGGGSGPASEVPEKKAPSTPMAGYAYGDKPTASSRVARTRYRSRGPVVNMPGFEQTADGGSRLFVQLSQSVPVEERAAQGSITYVLKGASPRVWNNTNALVTVHFNTPVARARLVPRGQDLHFIVELRSAATPTWKMSESTDKTSTLTIDFPKGEYLPAGGEVGAADGRPAEPGPRAIRRGGRRGPPPSSDPAP